MSKSYIRTSFVERLIRRFPDSLGANSLGASHVSCLYLEQKVCRSKDFTRISSLAASCTPYSGQRDCLSRTNKRISSFRPNSVFESLLCIDMLEFEHESINH